MIMNTIMNLNMCDCAAGIALVLGSNVPYKKKETLTQPEQKSLLEFEVEMEVQVEVLSRMSRWLCMRCGGATKNLIKTNVWPSN